MKTLALVQGDLLPSAGGYLMYSGASKIHQDLALALRETYGADTIHPRWGSVLQNYVGFPITAEMRGKVLVEINRVLSNYITVQNARIIQDNNNGTSSKLSSDDVVQSVGSVNVQQIYDSLVVSVILQTLSRQTININQIIS